MANQKFTNPPPVTQGPPPFEARIDPIGDLWCLVDRVNELSDNTRKRHAVEYLREHCSPERRVRIWQAARWVMDLTHEVGQHEPIQEEKS